MVKLLPPSKNTDRLGVFVAIPKVASRSTSAVFSAAPPEPRKHYNHMPISLATETIDIIDRKARTRETSPGLVLPTNYWAFSIVRNPWDRMVSMWAGYVQAGQYEGPFEEFVCDPYYVVKYPRWFQRHLSCNHVPQTYWLGGVHTVYRFEALATAWDDIASRGYERVRQFAHTGQSRRRPYREVHTQKTRDAVAHLFASDIKRFGYEF